MTCIFVEYEINEDDGDCGNPGMIMTPMPVIGAIIQPILSIILTTR